MQLLVAQIQQFQGRRQKVEDEVMEQLQPVVTNLTRPVFAVKFQDKGEVFGREMK